MLIPTYRLELGTSVFTDRETVSIIENFGKCEPSWQSPFVGGAGGATRMRSSWLYCTGATTMKRFMVDSRVRGSCPLQQCRQSVLFENE